MITAIFYIISIIGIVLLSLFTYARRREKGGIYFSLFSLMTAIWLFLQFLSTQYPNQVNTILTLGLLVFSFIPFLFYKFTYFFIDGRNRKNHLFHQLISYGSLFSLLLLSVLPDTISSASIVDGALVIETGFGYLLQSIVASILILYSVIIFLINFNKLDANKKKASKNLLYGMAVAVFGNLVSGLFFADISSIQFIGPLSVLLMSLFATYSITRHHLFDIKSTVVRTVAYIISISILVLLFVLSSSYLASLLEQEPTLRNIANAFAFIIFALLQKPVKKFIDRITNFLFYRDSYDPEQTLNDLGKILAEQIDLETIMNSSDKLLTDRLKVSKSSFLVFDANDKLYKIFNNGLTINSEKSLTKNDIMKFKKKSIFSRDQLDELTQKSIMKKYDVDVLVVLQTTDGVIGALLIGAKQNGETYTKSDLRFLDIASKQLAIAVQNARYFAEIAEFNATLQEKIKRATSKLEQTNEKLKELDAAKDEFISMASHQLRTPLTTVKGYLSMVLEGDAGKLNKDQHKFIDQAFGSAQRMVYLIADLLNVSRLNTGKFVIDTVETNLAEVVQQEVDQLQRHAKTRKINLKYQQPKKFPGTMLDETKIRQVIMNFTDNAIYYTKEGGDVTIELKDNKDSIEFTVTDTGIGVPKEIQPKLFSKFYRAENARQARPDGTGLGLFMAKKVIVASGGAVIFSSKENVGSTFGFTFPKKDILVKK